MRVDDRESALEIEAKRERDWISIINSFRARESWWECGRVWGETKARVDEYFKLFESAWEATSVCESLRPNDPDSESGQVLETLRERTRLTESAWELRPLRRTRVSTLSKSRCSLVRALVEPNLEVFVYVKWANFKENACCQEEDHLIVGKRLLAL